VNAEKGGESASLSVTQKAPAMAGAGGFYPVRQAYST